MCPMALAEEVKRRQFGRRPFFLGRWLALGENTLQACGDKIKQRFGVSLLDSIGSF